MISSVQLPLYGKRILVTAPRNYAARLSSQLINQGALPVLMPTIETCALADFTELDAALTQIDTFDWIAFTSRNGIDGFFQRLEAMGISVSVLKNCRVSAIGKDAERLANFGVKVDLIPQESSPKGIIAELAKVPDINKQTVLVPVPEVVGIAEPSVIPDFVAGLKNLGMSVTRVPTYMTRCLDKSLYEVELNLIRQGKIDVIAFSSTAEISGFLQMITAKADYQHCVIACFGPYTAANAKKLGINVSIVAENYSSFVGFAEAIANFMLFGYRT
ncbi:uroporphyrinogen-III synthase [Fischerella sp. JS2]|uniref:uroporphyrinogen-III synthase n=1 Tax=Fischerella sp. JS2 TaxID=2597771 RepID=UPI0028E263D5|nr:uroporphyrinogen-III synthase [Fischerella sp. JS2]